MMPNKSGSGHLNLFIGMNPSTPLKCCIPWMLFLIPVFTFSQDAASEFAKGEASHNKREYDQALLYYGRVLEYDPNFAKAYFNRGLIYFERGNFQLSIQDFEQTLRIEPRQPKAYYYKGIAFAYLNNPDAAINNFSRAIELENNSLYYSHRGSAYVQKKMPDSALQDLNMAILLTPDAPGYYLVRGNIYSLLQKYEAVIRDYSMAVSLAPNQSMYLAYRSLAYENIYRYDLALADITRAISLNLRDPVLNMNRGLIYNKLGQYEEAVTEMLTSLQKDPRNGKAHINIISPLVRLRRFGEAASWYQQYNDKKLVSHLSSERFGFFRKFMDAVSQLSAGRLEEAIITLEAAANEYGFRKEISTERFFVDVLSLTGYLLEKSNRDEEAEIILLKSLAIDKHQPDLAPVLKSIQEKKAMAFSGDNKGPEINLLYPSGPELDEDRMKLQIIGRALDGSGIASVRINDIPVMKLEEDGLFLSTQEFSSGDNSIVISATDKKGNITSKIFSVRATRGLGIKEKTEQLNAGGGSPPRYFAILIAAKDYADDGIPDLENPVKDARELKQILTTQYSFPITQVDTLFNSSREEIMQSIVQRCNSLNDNDNLVIFYAGHGTAEKDRFGDVDGYWIPASARQGMLATYISADDINKALKRSRARHVLVIADACFSGAFTRQLPADASKDIQRQYAVPSRKVMASGNLEPVPDNSKFLFYLKKSLRENKEKYISAKDLYDSFYKAILSNTDNLPQYAAIKNVGDEGGEFIFTLQ